MKKFVFAAVCTFALVGFVMGDEFLATISNVKDNTVTFKKGGIGKKKDGAEEAKEEKAEAVAGVKVMKGEFDFAGGKKDGKDKGDAKDKKAGGFQLNVKAGDPIEGGLKNEMFAKAGEKGVLAQITTDDKGKITQILAVDFGGFGGKKDGAAKGGFAKGDGAAKGGFAKGAAKGDGK